MTIYIITQFGADSIDGGIVYLDRTVAEQAAKAQGEVWGNDWDVIEGEFEQTDYGEARR